MLIKYTGKNKFIFIANTKSASTSIESSKIARIADVKLIDHRVGKHMPLGKVHAEFNFIFKEYKIQDFFKFGIIRDPLDWVVSWFNFRSRTALENPQHPNHKNYTGNMTFAEFWQSHKNKPFLRPQSQNFFAKDREIQLDYIILKNNLTDQLQVVEQALSIESIQIKKRNKSSVKRLVVQDVETAIKSEIEQKYHTDYQLINNLDEFNSRGISKFVRS